MVFTDEVDKKEYCLFHAPAEHKGMSDEDFNFKVFARINEFKAKPKTDNADETCDLSGTIFPDGIYFSAYGKDNPLPAISFIGATFGGMANFRRVTFSGVADFERATFSGVVDFRKTTFGGRAFFWMAMFRGRAYFWMATFDDEGLFSSATFGGKAEFQGCTFTNKVHFFKATFSAQTSFWGVKTDNNAVLLHSLSSASLANLNFSSMNTECLSFKGCEDWPDGGLWPETHALPPENRPNYKACEELYRSLKQKAAGEHDQPMVSKWHYREKLMAMRQKWYRRFVPLTPTWLYWASNGFGERSTRAWWLLVGLCLVPFALFGHERILETVRSGNPDWTTMGAIFDEWSLCIPFVQTGIKGTEKFAALEPWKLRTAWIFQILIALQASLFAFALRNRFRR